MLTDFKRDLELTDGVEYDYLKLLYYDLAPQFSSDYKSYENSRLCTILEGNKHVTVNKNISFTYEPGQFILLPPHSHVHMDIDVPTKALVFELNDSMLKKVLERISIDLDADCDSINEARFFTGKINDDLGRCLNRLTDISVKPDKNKEFLVDLYAQELVYNLAKIKGIQQVINIERNHPLQKALLYIHDNIKEQISISQLAYDLNMSEANFCQTFKKIMGITPKEYITNLKLIKAKDMLKNQNVTEVAYDLGYENISHFIALFKTKYDITPKQYQNIGKVPIADKY
jgi:AraC-like DNA-binding protein